MSTVDLTGTWRGHYEQAGSHHGIEMTVRQTGQTFVGRMRDHDCLIMSGHDDTDAPTEAVIELPEASTIRGRVDGHQIAFEKRYQGPQRTTVWNGEFQVEIVLPEHAVRYLGSIDPTGAVLRGNWVIGDAAAENCESGGFELARVEAPSP